MTGNRYSTKRFRLRPRPELLEKRLLLDATFTNLVSPNGDADQMFGEVMESEMLAGDSIVRDEVVSARLGELQDPLVVDRIYRVPDLSFVEPILETRDAASPLPQHQIGLPIVYPTTDGPDLPNSDLELEAFPDDPEAGDYLDEIPLASDEFFYDGLPLNDEFSYGPEPSSDDLDVTDPNVDDLFPIGGASPFEPPVPSPSLPTAPPLQIPLPANDLGLVDISTYLVPSRATGDVDIRSLSGPELSANHRISSPPAPYASLKHAGFVWTLHSSDASVTSRPADPLPANLQGLEALLNQATNSIELIGTEDDSVSERATPSNPPKNSSQKKRQPHQQAQVQSHDPPFWWRDFSPVLDVNRPSSKERTTESINDAVFVHQVGEELAANWPSIAYDEIDMQPRSSRELMRSPYLQVIGVMAFLSPVCSVSINRLDEQDRDDSRSA